MPQNKKNMSTQVKSFSGLAKESHTSGYYYGTYYQNEIVATNGAQTFHYNMNEQKVSQSSFISKSQNFQRVALHQDIMYMVSGEYTSNNLLNLYAYHIPSKQWRELPTLNEPPKARANSSLIVRTSNVAYPELVIYGGFNSIYYNDIWIYSLQTQKWRTVEQQATIETRCAHVCAYDKVQDSMLLFSGYNGKYHADFVEFSFGTNQWTPVIEKNPAERPTPSCLHAMLAVGRHKFYIALVNMYQS